MEGVTSLTGPLAEALKRNRQVFNAKFAVANNSQKPIDAQDFLLHLNGTLDPVVRSAAVEFPERTDLVVDALFDLSLELFGQTLLGAKARYGVIPEAWRALLPRLAKFVVREPARVAASVTNALYNLARTPGARQRDWSDADFSLCQSVGEFLDYGLVLAWRCGMPQFRQSALDKMKSMPTRLAAQSLGLPLNTTPESIEQTVGKLAVDPWLLPQDAMKKTRTRQLRIAAKAGAFRGFAGQFITPPNVARMPSGIIATDGTATWRLHADAFNSLLLRCEPDGAHPITPEAEMKPDGTIRWQGLERVFPELAHATSFATTPDTLAITIPTSHHIFLVAAS
jgi:hypothetical protein